jgi:DNA-binding NarL/FixJ family response regulator
VAASASPPAPTASFAGDLLSTDAEALRRSLGEDGIEVVALRADVVVRFGPLSNAGQLAQLRALLRGRRPVVAVVPSVSPGILRSAVRAGLLGCVVEERAPETLASAIRSVRSGHVVLPRRFFDAPQPVLSAREKQVLGMVVMGLTNAEIATRLHLAESTVKSHLSTCFVKLGVRNRGQAAALILSPDNELGLGILGITTGQEPGHPLASTRVGR